MKKLLLIEDSPTLASLIRSEITFAYGFECDVVASLKEVKKKVEKEKQDYFIAVLDLDFPDTSPEELVDYVQSQKLPVLAFSSEYSDSTRELMNVKNALDYIVYKDNQDLNFLAHTVNRIYRNQSTKILVVDDSRVSRRQMTKILETQKFIVFEAQHGMEALEILEKHQDIMLVITDYKMPQMDGFDLIAKIRKKYAMSEVGIIGISAYGSGLLSAQFLKKGANDFIIKPFLAEELYQRVKQNIEMMEYVDAYQKLSNMDYLTQLYNRRFFFDLGNKIFENAKRQNFTITTALIDIDNFKSINDTFGHEMGDRALKHVAKLLLKNLRTADIIARYGGEEFSILSINLDKKQAKKVFERIRQRIETDKLKHDDQEVSLTASIGVTTQIANSLEETVKKADELLYLAKQAGRNQIVIDGDKPEKD